MITGAREICLIVAVVLFAIAAFVGYYGTPRFGFMAGGLFFYALKDAV